MIQEVEQRATTPEHPESLGILQKRARHQRFAVSLIGFGFRACPCSVQLTANGDMLRTTPNSRPGRSRRGQLSMTVSGNRVRLGRIPWPLAHSRRFALHNCVLHTPSP